MRSFGLLLMIVLACGLTYVLSQYDIAGLDKVTLVPKGTVVEEPTEQKKKPVAAKARPSSTARAVRIATIDLEPMTQRKTSNRRTAENLAEIIRGFDLVAVQGVRAQTKSVLVEFVEQINAKKRDYNFAVSPRIGADPEEPHCAFLFDQDTIQIDRGTLVPVADPMGNFRAKPLVAAFRTAQAEADEAFTFTLINVQVDPDGAALEHDLLSAVYRTVRDDPRREDDIILLGNLAAPPSDWGPLGRIPNITWPVDGVPTVTGSSESVDNMLFDRRATTEFTGRSGVVDIVRHLDISLREAQGVTRHLPVWAEFSVYEGGLAGHLATRPATAPR